jgi:hypothetical protein
VTRAWSGDVVLLAAGQPLWQQAVTLRPGQPLRQSVAVDQAAATGRLTLRLQAADGAVVAEYTLKEG